MKLFYNVATKVANRFDKFFGTNIKEQGGRIYRLILREWSPIKRILDPIRIRLCYKWGIATTKDLKLHLGCGWKHVDGYVNVDLWITDATDIICDITDLPWPDNSVSIIESYHVIEHISHRKNKETLSDWFRVLKNGGKLILECPNFDKVIEEYLEGNEERLLNIFGRQRSDGDAHLYGYNPKRLISLLEEVGFEDICEKEPQSSQIKDEPCIRIECKKAE